MMNIIKLLALCKEYDLAGKEILENYTIGELENIYNGAGPDSWHELPREILTAMMDLFAPLILIHDVQFFESDGSESGFRKTVNDWKINSDKIFRADYPLCTWKILSASYRRKRLYWLGVKTASDLAIQTPSARTAWQSAHQKNQTERTQK